MAKDLENRNGRLIDIEEDGQLQTKRAGSVSSRTEVSALSGSPKRTTLLMRRRSAGQDGQLLQTTVPVKANLEDIRDHFKHLGPSNPASNPKSTRVSAVKIKPASTSTSSTQQRLDSAMADVGSEHLVAVVDERSSLLGTQLNAKDGIQALQQSYTEPPTSNDSRVPPGIVTSFDGGSPEQATKSTQTKLSAAGEDNTSPTQGSTTDSADSAHDVIGRRRGHVRSGSITENIVELGGIHKVILEANSSTSEDEGEGQESNATAAPSDGDGSPSVPRADKKKKKNRRKNRK